MKIGILGCGPAGLIAAATAEWTGAQVVLVSKKQKSYIAGAQYLHGGVPGLTDHGPDAMVEYVKDGTREGYAQKVYGDPAAPVSWDRYSDGATLWAWNMRGLYDALWDRYSDRVINVDLRHGLDALDAAAASVDRWVSTVPLPLLCQRKDSHHFKKQKVHIAQGEVNDRDNFILYNGEPNPSWYRRSVLFGYEAIEWSGLMDRPPVEGCVTIEKPLSTDCDCRPDIARLGRYGQWRKDALVHHVVPAMSSIINRQKENV